MPDGSSVDGCSGADYCLVKVVDTDNDDTPDDTEVTPRHFPERTAISDTNIDTDSDTGILDGITGSLLGPSSAGDTVTISFNADGSADAEVVSGDFPQVTVGPDDGSADPTHDISLNEATSRIKID